MSSAGGRPGAPTVGTAGRPPTDPGPPADDQLAPGVAGPRSLTVFYDPGCELCRRCRAWLEVQPTWVPVSFVAADAEAARRLLPQVPWLGTELVVIGDDGATWVGPAAFLTCLWATRRHRGWSHRLAGPAFAPLAERFFAVVSSNRGRVAAALRSDTCTDGSCRHRPPAGLARPGPAWPGPHPSAGPHPPSGPHPSSGRAAEPGLPGWTPRPANPAAGPGAAARWP